LPAFADSPRCIASFLILRKGFAMGIGHWELMIIGVVIVLLFGHRLPGVMHSLGQGIRMFQNGFREEESSPASDSSIHG
jgi:sec-independent protein translocase protein TatA